MMTNCGIYKILHKKSGRIYIGQSVDCYHRMHRHISELKYNRHRNKALQNAYNKYGIDAFSFEKILECSLENLSLYEKLCVDFYKSNIKPFGYNIREVVDSNRGIRFDSKVFFSGNKYGRLTLIRRDISRSSHSHWICICECGTEKSINAPGIKSGKIISCGCAMKGINSKHKAGDRNGMLTLISIVGQNKHGQNIGLFNCDCGDTKKTLVQTVMDGYIKSCGCKGRIKFVVINGERVSCLEASRRLGVSSAAIPGRARRRNETHQEACDYYITNKPPSVIVNGKKFCIAAAARKIGFDATSITFRMKRFGETHQQSCDHFIRKNSLKAIANSGAKIAETLQSIAA